MGRHRAWALAVACVAAGCGSAHATSSTSTPHVQRVSDGEAKRLLLRAFHAARGLGRHEGLCRGCYPPRADEITEDLNGVTGDPYAIAFTPFGARIPGVVYVDTVGAGKLATDRLTMYARTSNGTVWMLSARRGRPELSVAE